MDKSFKMIHGVTARTVLLPYCHPHYDTFRPTPAPIERYLASRYGVKWELLHDADAAAPDVCCVVSCLVEAPRERLALVASGRSCGH